MLSPVLRGRLLAAIAVGAVVGAYSEGAQACSAEPLIGSVCTTAIKYCPKDYLPADGRMLDIRNSAKLYALIGYAYGGDGASNFQLPDLRGRVAVGAGIGWVVQTGGAPSIPLKEVKLGAQRGDESTSLTLSQLPQHAHLATFAGALPTNTALSGTASLDVTGKATAMTLSGLTLGGSITVDALTSAAPPGNNIPSTTNNVVGRAAIGAGAPTIFFPYDKTKAIPVPVENTLTITGGTISDGTVTGKADGTVTLTTSASTSLSGSVTVFPTPIPTQPVSTVDPGLGLTVCIAVEGLWPQQQ